MCFDGVRNELSAAAPTGPTTSAPNASAATSEPRMARGRALLGEGTIQTRSKARLGLEDRGAQVLLQADARTRTGDFFITSLPPRVEEPAVTAFSVKLDEVWQGHVCRAGDRLGTWFATERRRLGPSAQSAASTPPTWTLQRLGNPRRQLSRASDYFREFALRRR